MKFIISAMTEENFIISEPRKKNRLVIHKRLRCMDVPIAAAAEHKAKCLYKYDAEKDAEKK